MSSIDAKPQLGAAVRAALEADLPVWLLVDPMLGEPLDIAADAGASIDGLMSRRERAWQRPITRVALAPTIALPAPMHPYLVALASVDDAWIEASVELATQERDASLEGGLAGRGRAAYRVSGWLQAASSAASIAAQLAAAAQLHTYAPTSASYLRMADRRTLDVLTSVVGPARIAGAMPALHRWVWIDICGGVSMIDVAPDPRALPQATPQTTRDESDAQRGHHAALQLTLAEWRHFELAHLVHPALLRWQGQCRLLGTPLEIEVHQALRRADKAVRQAQAAASRLPSLFDSEDDLIAWAALELLCPGFEHDARANESITAAVGRGDGFDALCHDIFDTVTAAAPITP